MAKLYASEVAVKCANEGVQIHGGYGFIKDYPAEKFYRDVKLCTIGEGTSEIQRLVECKTVIEGLAGRYQIATASLRQKAVDAKRRGTKQPLTVRQCWSACCPGP